MSRNEWIAVLKKAKELSERRNSVCFSMFGILLDAMVAVPVPNYRCDEESTEEVEE